MDGDNAWEKLHAAVRTLATGTDPLRNRLADAYVSSLMRLRAEHHFPWPDLRQRFEDLMLELAPNGRVDLVLRALSDEDLQRIAADIVSLYDRVTRRVGDHTSLEAAPSAVLDTWAPDTAADPTSGFYWISVDELSPEIGCRIAEEGTWLLIGSDDTVTDGHLVRVTVLSEPLEVPPH